MDASGALTKIIAGGVAGVSETLITYPAEFVKTRRQLHHKPKNTQGDAASRTKPPSSLSILRTTLRTQGFKGIYSGVQALAASNAAKSGIRFMVFESTRNQLDKMSSRTDGVKQPRKAWVNVVSGLSAGIAESILVVTPGEAIKTRMIHAASSSVAAEGSKSSTTSFTTSVRSLLKHQGILGLWSGLTPVLCKQGTNSAVRFSTYAILQERVADWWPSIQGSVVSTLVLGGISGVFTVYASMPFDNIKTRMQSVGAQYTGMWSCAAQILRHDGVLAFWRGTTPRLVRLTLSSGITFTVYEQVARLMKHSLSP